MRDTIFALGVDDQLQELTGKLFDSEADLQLLLARFPRQAPRVCVTSI